MYQQVVNTHNPARQPILDFITQTNIDLSYIDTSSITDMSHLYDTTRLSRISDFDELERVLHLYNPTRLSELLVYDPTRLSELLVSYEPDAMPYIHKPTTRSSDASCSPVSSCSSSTSTSHVDLQSPH